MNAEGKIYGSCQSFDPMRVNFLSLTMYLVNRFAISIFAGAIAMIFMVFPSIAQAADCEIVSNWSGGYFRTWDDDGDNFCDTTISCSNQGDFASSECSTVELHDPSGQNQYRVQVDSTRFDLFIAFRGDPPNTQRATPIGQGTNSPGVRVEVCSQEDFIPGIEFRARNAVAGSLFVEAVTFEADNSAGGMYTVVSSYEIGTTFGNGEIAGGALDFELDSFPNAGHNFAVAFSTINPAVKYDQVFFGHTFYQTNNFAPCPDVGAVTFDYRVTLVDEPDILVQDSDPPVTDLSVNFGIINLGTPATETITVINSGAGALSVNSVTVPSGAFSVVADSCSTLPDPPGLPPGQRCTFEVQFTPSVAGAVADTVTILTNDPDENPLEVAVSGAGVGTAPLPDIDVTPNSVDFGSVELNQTATRTITVMNLGNAELAIGTVAFNMSLPAWAKTSDGCSNQSLGPSGGGNDSCTVGVTYTPNMLVQQTNFLLIPSNDPDEDQVSVLLTGTGVPTSVAMIIIEDDWEQIDDQQIDFPDTTAGVVRQSQVTIRNDNAATADLEITSIDSIAQPFAIDDPNGCSTQILVPGDDCIFTVQFAPEPPTTTGAFSDAVSIQSNDPDTPTVEVSLTGTFLETGANNPPDPSRLVFPANGQQDVAVPTDFRWRPASDPEADPVSYDLIVCVDPTLQSCSPVNGSPIAASVSSNKGVLTAGTGYGLVLFGVVLAGGLRRRRVVAALLVLLLVLGGMMVVSCGGGGGSSGTPDVTFTLDNTHLDPATQYYWAVLSDDGQDATASVIWTFTTQ